MGIVDKLNETFNKGVSETERMLEVGKLKTKISTLGKNRNELLTALGAVAYDQFRRGVDDPTAFAELGEKIRGIELEIAQTQARLVELESSQDAGRVSCPVCAAPNASGAAFCVKCGTALPKPEAKSTCASCGAQMPADGKFCTRCGTPVTAPAEDSVSAPEVENPKGDQE